MHTTAGIRERRAEITDRLADARQAYEDVALQAESDPDLSGQVAEHARAVESIEEELRTLDAVERAAGRRSVADRAAAEARRRREAIETVINAVGDATRLGAMIQQQAGELAALVHRFREAEQSAGRVGYSVLDARTREALGSVTWFLYPDELAALLAGVATGRVGDIDITGVTSQRARRLLQTVQRAPLAVA